jgi:cardiolipin synthase (CMP-forming)
VGGRPATTDGLDEHEAAPSASLAAVPAERLRGENLGRVATFPNLLSVSRLALLAGFFLALFGSERVLAAVLLALAGTTDFLDGYVARRFNQVSTIGKMLDPTVDRLVVGGAVLASVVYGAIPVWLAAAVLAREALTSAMVLLVAALAGRRIDVIFIGKAGTFGLMCALPLLVLGDGAGAGWHVVRVVGYAIALSAFALSCLATLRYLPVVRRSLAAGARREDRSR